MAIMGRGSADGSPSRGGIRWWVLVLFAGYAAWNWFGNSQTDPYTGAQAHYGASVDEEAQLGLQAYQQVLAQEQALDAADPRARKIEAIARRLVDRSGGAGFVIRLHPGTLEEGLFFLSSPRGAAAVRGGRGEVEIITGRARGLADPGEPTHGDRLIRTARISASGMAGISSGGGFRY